MENNKYEYPSNVIKQFIFDKVGEEILQYVHDCLNKHLEPDLKSYLKSVYNYDSITELANIVTENEKYGFEERLLESVDKLKLDREELILNTDLIWSNYPSSKINVPSLTFFWDDVNAEFATEIKQEVINELTISAFNIKEIKPKNKKLNVIYVMDTSGSVGIWEKFIACSHVYWLGKIFSMIYKQVDCRYIVHGVSPQEIDGDNFFNHNCGGGTILSSAMKLVNEVINRDFSLQDDTIVFQFSDGDNLTSDCDRFIQEIEKIIDTTGCYNYIETNQYSKHSTSFRAISESNIKNTKSGESTFNVIINKNEVKNSIENIILKSKHLKDYVIFND